MPVPGDEFWDFVQEKGPIFNLQLMFADVICTISPDHLKRVLATEFDKFAKGGIAAVGRKMTFC